MSLEAIFYLKMTGVFIISGIIFKFMMVHQKRKEDKARIKFQETMKMIEVRNKTYRRDEK